MSRYFGSFFDFPGEVLKPLRKNAVRNKSSEQAFDKANNRTKLYGGGNAAAMKKLQQALAAKAGQKKTKKPKPSMMAMAIKGKR